MCSRAGARSVAAMRLSPPPPHRRRRSHGGGAGRRPARARRGRRLRRHRRQRRRDRRQGRLEAPRLRSIVISWRAPCDDGRRLPSGGELTPAKPAPGFSPGPRTSCWSPGTPRAASPARSWAPSISARPSPPSRSRSRASSRPTRASGTLSAIAKIADKATGPRHLLPDRSAALGRDARARARLRRRHLAGRAARRAPRTRSASGSTTCCSPGARRARHRGASSASPTLRQLRGQVHGQLRQPVQRRRRDGRRREAPLRLRDRRTLTKKAAKGTLQVKVAETDAAGAATDLRHRRVTWKAATG